MLQLDKRRKKKAYWVNITIKIKLLEQQQVSLYSVEILLQSYPKDPEAEQLSFVWVYYLSRRLARYACTLILNGGSILTKITESCVLRKDKLKLR